MGSRMRRWRSATGIASTILGVFFLAFFMLLAVALTTYQQIAATRQVVTTTATAALRSAVPGSFVSESVATAHSQQASNLLVSATAYDLAIGHILPEYWPGAKVQACLATPQGSPAPCTPGSSYLVTLPPATADALHIAGPMVVTNVQLVTTAPYKVTHFGQTTTWPEPVVAADVAVPLRISIGSLINIRPWATVAITNVLYADQGGQTGGNSRYIAYGTAPSQGGGNGGGSGGGSSGATSHGLCWQWPDSTNPACATEPPWCGGTSTTTCTLTSVTYSFGGGVTGLSVGFYNPTDGGYRTATLGSSTVASLPWATPPSNRCWVETTANHYALTGTPGSSSCVTLTGDVPAWATTVIVQEMYQPGFPPTYTMTPCYGGSLPGASASSAPVTGYFCGNYTPSGSGSGSGSGTGTCYAYGVSASGTKQCIGN